VKEDFMAKREQAPAEERDAPAAAIPGEPLRKGGILAALRRSPLVGTDLDLARDREEGRKTDI
jgi:hypothetical protein